MMKNQAVSPSNASIKPLRIAVGLSGGVDSSVTAALLKEQGHEVIGIYMKNWSIESPAMGRRQLSADAYRLACPWYDDYLDAKRVALQLGIPFLMWDFRASYKEKVFDHVIDEFEKGRTPNPDVYCNSRVKFEDFLDKAVAELGVDAVATGHYARTVSLSNGEIALAIPKDAHKDQTYFLYRLSASQRAKARFPLADLTKTEVRELAKKYQLPTQYKKDSQGICFIGEVEVRDFLTKWLAPKPGKLLTLEGQEVGIHDGVHLYTIGEKVAVDNAKISTLYPDQKEQIPGYYIASKDVAANTLTVVPGSKHPAIYSKTVVLEDVVWADSALPNDQQYMARLRHGGALIGCTVSHNTVTFEEQQRAIAEGQHLVLYKDNVVVGGGVMTSPSS
jgi:tRNA-specific 2-thiouridylase